MVVGVGGVVLLYTTSERDVESGSVCLILILIGEKRVITF